MERKYIVVLVLAAIGGALVGQVIRHRNGPTTVADLPPPAWPLAQGIDEAAAYLVRVDDDKGRFVYQMAADGHHIAPTKYNVVRHAGAIYALSDYEAQSKNADVGPKAGEAATRSAEQLVTHYVRPIKDQPDILAVWSDPKEEGGNKVTAKLGGSGLGLIGLMGRYRAIDGGANAAADLATAQGLARFIVFMQKENGDFTSKYNEIGGKSPEFESLYYPGEAILGLTMLYEVDHDQKWLETAEKGVAYLVQSRRGQRSLPADHWLMIAMDRLYPVFGDLKTPPLTRDEMVEHAIALGKAIVDGQERVGKVDIDGCYTSDGRTTPSATRLEGLLALEHMLGLESGHAETRKYVRGSIVSGIAFLRRAQITVGPTRGGLPKQVPIPSEPDAGEAGDDSEDDQPGDHRAEVRIDYVQHAMSAMMRYAKMCSADPKACPR